MYRKLFGMIHTMLSIMFNSGEKVEIEGRSELGLFFYMFILFGIICVFYFYWVGFAFLEK